MSRLPDFLIIGAMKSGTTTLYEDLRRQPGVYFPAGEKEPGCLAHEAVLTPRGRDRYERLYRQARPGDLCGDASTIYAKLPEVQGVAERARELLGPELKVIYLVREPISRTISHHYHELARGEISEPLDEAVHSHPVLIDFSRYAFQLRPWIETFGRDRVLVVRFEDFIADRASVILSVCGFLGVPPHPEKIEGDRAFNAREQLPIPRGAAWRFSRGPLYRKLIRPLLPGRAIDLLRLNLLPKPPPDPPAPAASTLRHLAQRLAPDVDELGKILGMDSAPWDLEEAVQSKLQSVGKANQGCP